MMSAVQPGRSEPDAFAIFSILWVTATLMEMVEYWKYPLATLGIFLLAIVVVFFGNKRVTFPIFLVATTIYFFVTQFPEVANHINLLLFCNLLLIAGLLYSYASDLARQSFSAYFGAMQSPLRLMLIVTYSVAGFHKFNYDFLNPEVSCIGDFLGYFERMLVAPFFAKPFPVRIPVYLVLALLLLAVLLLVLRYRSRPLPKWLLGTAVVSAGLFGIAAAWGLAPQEGLGLTPGQVNYIVLAIAGLIVFWQLVEGPLLLVPRLQLIILCFAMLVHTYLAMIGFVDFQSIALALIFTFVPPEVLRSWNKDRVMRFWRNVQVDRVRAYFLLNAAAGIIAGVHFFVTPIFAKHWSVKAIQGIFFNLAVLLLLWPLVKSLVSRNRTWKWKGVAVLSGKTPGFLYLFPVFLLLFGMTSHLGLRTAGNFSMFSNLKTEGEVSNHVLFSSNPIKIWGYQEDVVHILELDDDKVRTGHHYDENLEGKILPVVEFRKLVYKWFEAGMIVPIVFDYEGSRIVSDNIAGDPRWRPDRLSWEMRLLDFRVIQPEGPNECRW